MPPPIPHIDFSAINHSQINRLSNPFYQLTNIPFNKLTKKCKTNPILCLFGPKTEICPKNKANSKPNKANISPKMQVQTQKQTQIKAKLRQFGQNRKRTGSEYKKSPGLFQQQRDRDVNMRLF
ncbi:MAG: hypothetical protein WC374_06070 [Phycisphaerae bacterium]|jgi:hypothetical protein